MKKVFIVLTILFLLFMTGCQAIITKYQCSNGIIVDNETMCSEQICPVCKNEITEKIITKNVTVIKYQCADGTIEDSPRNCPAIEVSAEPVYSDYDTSKHFVNKKVTHDPIAFTVKYAGFDDDTYKVEFEVKNIGSETEYFQPEAIAILDSNKNQYDVYNTFDYPVSAISSTILPGVTKSGYWLFEDIPKNSGTGTFQFETGFMEKETYSFTIPLN